MNYNIIDSTRTAPLSMNELTMIIGNLELVYKYFAIQNIKILGIKQKL